MAADNIISLGFNYDELTTEQKAVVALLDQVLDKAKQLNGIQMNPSTDGLGQFRDNLRTSNEATAALTAILPRLTQAQIDSNNAAKAAADLATKQARATGAQSDAARKAADAITAQERATQAANKTAQQAQSQSEKTAAQLAKEAKAAADAANEYIQLKKAYAEAALEAKRLAIAQPGSDQGKAANANANMLREQLENAEVSIGEAQRRVGQYERATNGLMQYANALRGARGITRLFAEATGIGVMQLESIRIVLEHVLQAMSKFTGGKAAETAATQADNAATNTNTVSHEANNTAMAEGAVATNTLSTGMKILYYSGIAVVVAGLGYLVYSLVKANEAYEFSQSSLGRLASSSKELGEQFKALGNDPMKILEAATDELQKQLEGLNKEMGYGTVTAADKATAAIEDYAAAQDKLAAQIASQGNGAGESGEGNSSGVAGAFTTPDQLEEQKKVERAQDLLDKVKAAEGKKANDEDLKVQLDQLKDKTRIINEGNSRILSNEKSMLNDRLGAYRSNYDAQLALIDKEEKTQYQMSNTTGNENRIATAKANADRIVAMQQYYEDASKVTKSYSDRDRAAAFAILQATLKEQAEAYKKIQDDTKEGGSIRLGAQIQYYALEKQLIDGETAYKLQKEGLTAKEIEAIHTEGQYKLLAVDRDYAALNKAINEKAHAEQLAEAKAFQDALISNDEAAKTRLLAIQKSAADDMAALLGSNNSSDQVNAQKKLTADLENQLALHKGNDKKLKEVADKYNEDKEATDRKYAQREIDNQVLAAENQLNISKRVNFEDKKTQDAHLADITAQTNKLNELKTKQTEQRAAGDVAGVKSGNADDKRGKFGTKYKDEISEAESAESAIQSIVDARYDLEENRIKRKMDLLDIATEAEIRGINASTLSNQEKAAQLIIAEKTAAVQKQALQREERANDEKKAKFDRDAAILKVTAGIAIDLVDQEYAAAALGGAELVKLIATPIPKYADGIEATPRSEWAITGEGKHPEIVQEPNKSPYVVSTATLSYLPKNTRVTPILDNAVQNLGNAAMSNQFMSMARLNGMMDIKVQMGEQRMVNGIVNGIMRGLNNVESAVKRKQPINVRPIVDNSAFYTYKDSQTKR